MSNQYMYGWVDPGMENPGNDSWQAMKISRRGELRIIDFVTEMLMQGRGYQIRLGTITTGATADGTAITDTAAEMCVDAASGLTIIPVKFHIGMREVATTTFTEVAVKAVGSASSAGTAFVPLPLLQGGDAASSTARAAQTGGVTVAAELSTTTRRLFEWESLSTQAAAGPVVGPFASISAGALDLNYIGKGVACIYVQVASATAQVLHFSTLDYIELPSTSL